MGTQLAVQSFTPGAWAETVAPKLFSQLPNCDWLMLLIPAQRLMSAASSCAGAISGLAPHQISRGAPAFSAAPNQLMFVAEVIWINPHRNQLDTFSLALQDQKG
jgi:hypothetical protein